MQKYKILKAACYTSSLTMSVVGNLSPILFITFNSLYGISYSLLGLLVLINFVTQLGIDLAFSFFSHKFNIPMAVKLIPIIAITGLLIYALFPLIFSGYEYLGLSVGTIIFSAAAGLGEVLISPVIATIPAQDPDREMSKLHSVYAWGVVGVIPVATLFLLCFGNKYWFVLPLIFALIPLVSAILYAKTKIPKMDTPEKATGALSFFKSKTLWLCVLTIFFGGASELTMAQWCSGFLEKSVGIPKIWGDIFGVALFGLMLALGRTLYAKRGKSIERVLVFSFLGAFICYILAVITPFPFIGLIACAFTGFCVAMLWPGTLVVAADYFTKSGVFIYALMAAGGDLGASVGPQLVGIITDFTISNKSLSAIASGLAVTTEQLGLKIGILIAAVFPLSGLLLAIRIYKRKRERA